MEHFPTNLKTVNNNNKLSNYSKNSKKLNHCLSENDEEQNFKTNFDKDTLNLFKGIVKITHVSHNNKYKAPIIKSNSDINKNIFSFVNGLYNNEEHLMKTRNDTLKKLETKSSQKLQIKTFSHKLSMDEKCDKSRSSRMIPNLSKEKNISPVKKSLFKKSSCNDIGHDIKRQASSVVGIKNKVGVSSNINNKSPNKYAFFFKLKEKEKNPSKTPYLDKKFWKSSYNLPKYNNNNVIIKKNNLNIYLADQTQSPKNKSNNIVENGNNKEIIIDKNETNKKLLPDNTNKVDNNIISKNIDIVEKKENIKIDNNNEDSKNKNWEQNKKEKKKSNGIIINILNKPFFCCLKS